MATTITADLVGGTNVNITNGRHVWVADEPTELSGTDLGPNPYELLLGSVAACTAITISFYAKRKGIVLDSVSVEYSYDRIHADDCADCEDDAAGMLDHVTSQVYIEGTFTDDQRKRIGDIAKRCPVHRTLASGIHFSDNVHVG
ncbi:MAG: OsmC family protein [Actinobacteria bacterium]|nr:OsmC family protein [Actinomycetota bacterium]